MQQTPDKGQKIYWSKCGVKNNKVENSKTKNMK